MGMLRNVVSAAALVAILGIWGCSDDDSPVGPGDSGSDAAEDGASDGGLLDGSRDGAIDGSADASPDANPDGGPDAAPDGGPDASPDGAPDADASGPEGCLNLGSECLTSFECCGGRSCEEDATGTRRCSDETVCTGAEGACDQAADCCSLSCNGGTCDDGGTLCKPSGEDCAAASECCTNVCDTTCQPLGGGCGTLGEVCGGPGDCCSRQCSDVGGGELRCTRSSTCGARGEVCGEDSDCCSGVCIDGACPSQADVGQKRFVGEPCERNSDCASYACAPTFEGGTPICQFLGGCRPAEEICTADWQCCSFLSLRTMGAMCVEDGEPRVGEDGSSETPSEPGASPPGACVAVSGVPGLYTCRLEQNDKEVGEICHSDGVNVHNCCRGDEACQVTRTGVSRCLGNYDPGDECLADGEACSVADVCCSGVCAPQLIDGMTVLVCAGGCLAQGAACTADSDCCNFSCVDGVCRPPTPPADGGVPDGGADGSVPDGGVPDAEPPPPVCRPLGTTCASDDQCCSGFCAGTCQSIPG